MEFAPRTLLPSSSRPSGATRAVTVASVLTLAALFLPGFPGAGMALDAQQPRVSIEALLSAPFPSGLTAAAQGGHLAWVENDQGRRNIRVASPPEYEGRRITSYMDDDGQDVGSLAWTPDASTLVYVRGGAPNRLGEIPNPASDPAGAERALWRISVDGGDPVRIGPGSSPAVSPRGDGVAFLRGGAIWFAPLDGSAEPSVMVQARGGLGSLRWSPDGSRLAFVSGRGTHAFVGVYDLEARTVRWMDPSVDRDSNPVWSPDGRRLAYIRTPTSSELTIFRAVREARPWSIRVAEVSTGRVYEAWRAREGRGSAFRGVVAENQLLWGEGDRIVFPWEANGWTLLYSVPVAGGEATLLTPGEFEVEYVTLGPDGSTVYFNSNQGDIDRRHLWRVSVRGGPVTALTRGDGIEWEPAPTSDGRGVAYLRSGARTPAEAVILIGSETRALVPGAIPSDFPERDLVVPEAVTIMASDGMRIPAQLFLPPNLRPGERRPAVAYFHGGSRRQMLLGFHYGLYYHHAYALNQYLATQGYVVLSVNFRSGIGYGMEFREAIDFGAAGGTELHDVLGAGLYLASHPDVDPDRIGLWGGSYGGYLTAQGLAHASDLFAAGVDVHGVHDWNVGIQTFIPGYNPLEDPERTRVAFEASPMAHLDRWRSPVLVISGDDDRNVRFLETVTLVEALRERDVHVEQLVFPDEVHSFLLHENWLSAYRATADFFRRMLRDR
jgi:dipeptidyl aminopeptidase/acylaminoacyl peptidase